MICCVNFVFVFNFDFEWVLWVSNGVNIDFISWVWDVNGCKEGVEDVEDLIVDVGYMIELV